MNIISCVLKMGDELMKTPDLIWQNLLQSQAMQKKWYEHSARQPSFELGEEVLLPLQMPEHNFLAQWQGLHQIKQKMAL